MWPGQQAVAEFALDAGIEQRDCLRLAKQADGARGAAEDRLVELHNEGGGMPVGCCRKAIDAARPAMPAPTMTTVRVSSVVIMALSIGCRIG
ncbi:MULTISPECIES: hypothetical protein [unclassified Rhizobium]|uniref:hypothetical protein n=1 Tax=unclassified Rhizobium TaxID=2613769 RepID=UPI001FDF82DC|nr:MULTISPECIES: hypothetical protein [unclassified Rhizobium]MDF0664401.1 hypothetical protein [Rhizobium sp. BC49]